MPELRRILFAEDSEKDTELALEAFKEFHLANRVDVVRDGAEALDYVYRRNRFADRAGHLPILVLLDLKMPKIDGLEVLRQIKADPETKRIPVVMTSSSREEQDVIRSYELGVNSYVVKPVRFDEFLEAVKRLGVYWAVINEAPQDQPADHV